MSRQNGSGSSNNHQQLPSIRDELPEFFPPREPNQPYTVHDPRMQVITQSNNPACPRRSSGQGGRHVCDFCGSPFPTPSALDTHRRTHTGDKPFQCNLCGQYFNVASNLQRHIKNKHSN